MTEEIVRRILARHADAPLSHSAKWHTDRRETVGGSEIATLLGLNPYRKPSDFVAEKCGFGVPFEGNAATRWGTVMERVTESFTHAVLKMTSPIHAMGSIETAITGQRYTPDGLGVIKLRNVRDEWRNFVTVFEFKSPFRTVPNGKIPKHYAPQLQTGLFAIPEAHVGIFTNCAFRKCKAADFNFALTYDTVYHKEPAKLTKAQAIREVYAIGRVDFMASVEECQAFADGKYVEESEDIYIYNNEVIDVGAAGARLTERLFELVTWGRLTARYSPINLNASAVNQMSICQTHNIQHTQDNSYNLDNLTGDLSEVKNLEDVEDSTDASDLPDNLPDNLTDVEDLENLISKKPKITKPPKLVAFMCWKLVKADIITMDRDDNWRAVIEPVVTSTLAEIAAIRQASDPYFEYQKKYGHHIEAEIMNITGPDSGDVYV